MMLRWISSVPPAMPAWNELSIIVLQRAAADCRRLPGHDSLARRSRARSPGMRQAITELPSLPSEPPGPGALPALSSARVRIATSDLVVSIAVELHQLIAHDRIVDPARWRGGRRRDVVHRLADRTGAHRADRDALVHQHRRRLAPAVVELADQPVGGDADVGEEHLVEVTAAVDLVDRPDLDAGRPACRR